MVGARRQTLTHEQRMPTSHCGTDKYAFSTPYDDYSVDNKQSHCRPVVSYSQSKNTVRTNREDFTCNMSFSNDSYVHGNQTENALTTAIQSLTGVITKFQSLVGDMSCGDNAKCKRIGMNLPRFCFVFSK